MTERLHPPSRLLCGPGPSDVSESVLGAMREPILGHMDPDFRVIMNEVVEMLTRVYQRTGGVSFPVSGTGHSGVEAGVANLIEPGEKAIVGIAGFFGGRIAEMVRRHGSEVIAVEADWGTHVSVNRLIETHEQHPDARLLALVQAETSTGMRQPADEFGRYLAETDTLYMLDCVTSLGGIEVDVDGWGVDFAYSCSQKCLASPPGLSPITVSDRALDRVRARTEPTGFYLDLDQLTTHWSEAYYHRATPILSVYALHESCARLSKKVWLPAGNATKRPGDIFRRSSSSGASRSTPRRVTAFRS